MTNSEVFQEAVYQIMKRDGVGYSVAYGTAKFERRELARHYSVDPDGICPTHQYAEPERKPNPTPEPLKRTLEELRATDPAMIREIASQRVHEFAMHTRAENYREAVRKVLKQNPGLAVAYNNGTIDGWKTAGLLKGFAVNVLDQIRSKYFGD